MNIILPDSPGHVLYQDLPSPRPLELFDIVKKTNKKKQTKKNKKQQQQQQQQQQQKQQPA